MTAERALLLWQVLIKTAVNRQTITYSALATAIGQAGMGRTLGPDLDRVAAYCYANSLPHLPIIVVRKGTGVPSYVPPNVDVDSARETAFAHNWFATTPPTLEELDRNG